MPDETPTSPEAPPIKRGRGNPNRVNPGGVVDPGREPETPPVNPRAYLANIPSKPASPHYGRRPNLGPQGNPNFVEGNTIGFAGHPENQNPGGVIRKKVMREALMKLMAQKPDKEFKAKTKAEEIVFELYSLALLGGKSKIAAIREILDRVDGKAMPSNEEADAIATSGAKVLIIDSAGRPPRTYGEE